MTLRTYLWNLTSSRQWGPISMDRHYLTRRLWQNARRAGRSLKINRKTRVLFLSNIKHITEFEVPEALPEGHTVYTSVWSAITYVWLDNLVMDTTWTVVEFCDHVKHHAYKGPSSQSYDFSSSHVWMWELDYNESWAPKNWCFWTVMLDKTLESPVDCKEIQPVHSKGNQSWIFIGRTDAEAGTPILWPPNAKNWLTGKDPDVGKDWRQKEKGTENKMVG